MIKWVKHILYRDNFVSKHKAADEHRNQRGIALIAAVAFAVMSILNIKQKSIAMLLTTGISSVFLIIGYFISKYKNYSALLRVIFYIIFVVVFTAYTVMGGNDGFAVLWLVTATYAVMIAIDFKAGFIISTYYLFMLILVFLGPLSWLLQYDYNKTFMLRFPFLYAINFAFATYIMIRVRRYQYELLIKQQEMEYLNTTDLSTGLLNRNSFIQNVQVFQSEGLHVLAAVFIDVNGLHEVNNRMGHDAGDKMLCDIAELCKQHFCYDTVYRMGGDEFLILCKNAEEQDVLYRAKMLSESIERGGYSISYGVAAQKSDFDLEVLVKDADEKMIHCKSNYYKENDRRKR